MMRNDDGGLALHQAVQRFHDGLFRSSIQTGGWLVQNQDWSVVENRAGDGNALALAAGKRDAALADHRVVALRHLLDELVGIGQFRGANDFPARGIRLAVSDVFPDRRTKQQGFLQHETDLVPQGFQRVFANVSAINFYCSGCGIVETRDQIDESAFSRAGRADDCRDLARFDFEADVFQYLMLAVVTERDVVEFDFALEFGSAARAGKIATLLSTSRTS